MLPSPLPHVNLDRSLEQTSTSPPTLTDAKKAGEAFEAFFLSILLKQGLLKADKEEGEQSGGFSEGLQEFAVEQVSHQIAKHHSMGIAEMIYAQLEAEQQPQKDSRP